MDTAELIQRLKVFPQNAQVGVIGKIIGADGKEKVDWFPLNDQDVWLYQGKIAIEGVKDVKRG